MRACRKKHSVQFSSRCFASRACSKRQFCSDIPKIWGVCVQWYLNILLNNTRKCLSTPTYRANWRLAGTECWFTLNRDRWARLGYCMPLAWPCALCVFYASVMRSGIRVTPTLKNDAWQFNRLYWKDFWVNTLLAPFTLLTSHFTKFQNSPLVVLCGTCGSYSGISERIDAHSFIDEVILCTGRARSVTQKNVEVTSYNLIW